MTMMPFPRHRSSRGVTLVEISAVLGVAAVIAGATSLVVGRNEAADKLADSQHDASRILHAAEVRQDDGNTGCPTPTLLKHEQYLASNSAESDAWGNRFRIVCEDQELEVRGAGPDGKRDTADDVRAPQP